MSKESTFLADHNGLSDNTALNQFLQLARNEQADREIKASAIASSRIAMFIALGIGIPATLIGIAYLRKKK